MSQLIYIDQKWIPRSEAKVSVFDHGFLYGDGVFEGIRAYHGHIFRLDAHLDRLYRSADKISLEIPMKKADMKNLLKESLSKNNLSDAYIRLLVTRGEGDLGLDIRACSNPNIILIADKLALYPKKFYDNGLTSLISKVRRTNVDALDPSIKSMNYLNMILAKIEATRVDAPEAIMLNHDGYVSECSGDNIFYVKDNHIVTPPPAAGVLVGITRGVVIEIINNKTNYSFEEKLFKPEALYAADEVFFTGTAAEVIPVTTIDQKSIGTGKPGTVTKELIKFFHSLTEEESR